jgi:uncharacterized protein
MLVRPRRRRGPAFSSPSRGNARVQELNVSVAEILGRPGEYRDLRVDRPLPGVRTALARLAEGPVRADLRAESVVEGILITGRVRAGTVLSCARCLEEFPSRLGLELCELYAGPGHESSAEDEAYRVRGREIDLEPMLRDALTLALPLHPLCREDCPGLCPSCGRRLDVGTCDCFQDEADPRWAELDALREKLS